MMPNPNHTPCGLIYDLMVKWSHLKKEVNVATLQTYICDLAVVESHSKAH